MDNIPHPRLFDGHG